MARIRRAAQLYGIFLYSPSSPNSCAYLAIYLLPEGPYIWYSCPISFTIYRYHYSYTGLRQDMIRVLYGFIKPVASLASAVVFAQLKHNDLHAII